MRNYDVVLFDLDGTLTQSAPGIMNSARYAARQMNYPVADDAVFSRFIGPPLHHSFTHLLGMTDEQAEMCIRDSVPIAQHQTPRVERRTDHLAHMLRTLRRVQICLRQRGHFLIFRIKQQPADFLADGAAARLARIANVISALFQMVAQLFQLRRLAGSVQPFDAQENAAFFHACAAKQREERVHIRRDMRRARLLELLARAVAVRRADGFDTVRQRALNIVQNSSNADDTIRASR